MTQPPNMPNSGSMLAVAGNDAAICSCGSSIGVATNGSLGSAGASAITGASTLTYAVIS